MAAWAREFRNIVFILRKDLQYMLRERETLLWVFVLPLLFFYFIGTITGGFAGSGEGPTATPIAYYVPDGAGHLADRLQQRLEAADFQVVRRDTLPPAGLQGRWISLPPGFTDSVMVGTPAAVRFHPRAEGLRRDHEVLRVGRTVYTLLADVVAADRTGRGPTATVLDSLEALPRPLQVSVAPAGRRREIPTGYEQTIPGTMVMFTLLIMTTSGAVLLVIERRQGLLRRLAATPIPRGSVVVGKWGAKFALGLVQIGWAMIAGAVIFHMDWGPALPAVIAVMASYGALMAAVGLLLGTLARTEGAAVAIGVVAANVLGALGGCWWPIEIAPAWMQRLALFLPTGWAMDALHELVSFGAPPLAVLPHVAGMSLGAGLLLLLSTRTFRYQ
ncbi:MAG: ABC transporter permease [Candidatus Krumholzibacteriia bacterium]